MRCHSVACGMASQTQSAIIGYARFYSRSHDAVIRVYDEAGTVIALISADSRQSGLLRRWLEEDPAGSRHIFSRASCWFYSPASKVFLVRHAAPHVEIAFATVKGNKAGTEPAAHPRTSAR
jgi:hypothetical protein